jgi:hypothetical protein
LNVDIPTMAGLTGGNKDTSGGYNDVGRRQYSLRYAGKYDLDEFGDMVLDWRGGNPVRLRDIATIEIKLRDEAGALLADGKKSIAFNAQVEKGVNVLDVMDDLKVAVAELREGPLQRVGLDVRQSYDESEYITDSISMLRTNLLLGITLATGVLWWFLRRFRATLMVAVAIPICLFTAFLVLQIAGRSLNIISLAGLAFAMGMVLDGAIRGDPGMGSIAGVNCNDRGHLHADPVPEGFVRSVVRGPGAGYIGRCRHLSGDSSNHYPDGSGELAKRRAAERPARGLVAKNYRRHHEVDGRRKASTDSGRRLVCHSDGIDPDFAATG